MNYNACFPSVYLHAHTGSAARVMNYFNECGIDPAISEAITFGVMSFVTMGQADTRWPNGAVTPIGGNVLLSANSSSSKSFPLHALLDKVNQFPFTQTDIASEADKVDLLVEDATREAIVLQLKQFLVAALISEEAGMLQRLMADSAALAKLLDCRPLRHARVSDGRTNVPWYRFCMMLLEQPDVFEKHKVLMGASRGGTGLINRFFVVEGGPMRAHGGIHHAGQLESAAPEFLKRMIQLLEATIQQVLRRVSGLPVLDLSPDAKRYLIEVDAEIRRLCTGNGLYSKMPEYGTRHVERVLRMSGSDHVFHHGVEGEIQLETVQRINQFGQNSLMAFFRMTYVPPKCTKDELDAIALEAYVRRCIDWNKSCPKLKELKKCAPNFGLTSTRVSRALAWLGEHGRAQIFPHEDGDLVVLTNRDFSRI